LKIIQYDFLPEEKRQYIVYASELSVGLIVVDI